jgi:hypothetical protein
MSKFVNFLKSILNFLLGRKQTHKTVQQTVYETIKSFGKEGCISDDVLTKNSNLRYSSVTARYHELIEMKAIELTGEYRPGLSGKNQRVMRVKGA